MKVGCAATGLAAGPGQQTTGTGEAALTSREREVLSHVARGHSYARIGQELYISPKTVEHHVARIRVKVGATDRAEFVAALKSLLNS